MDIYVSKSKPPSPEGFKVWVQMGYLGSYEKYAASVRETEGATIFLHGDLGPHCAQCAAPSEVLCDYPVGNDKTCDRALCEEHSHGVANDVHYCRDHFIMWREYLATNRGYDVLDNVTPLGVVKKCDSDGTATAAANGDLPVSKDCQAQAAGIAKDMGQ